MAEPVDTFKPLNNKNRKCEDESHYDPDISTKRPEIEDTSQAGPSRGGDDSLPPEGAERVSEAQPVTHLPGNIDIKSEPLSSPQEHDNHYFNVYHDSHGSSSDSNKSSPPFRETEDIPDQTTQKSTDNESSDCDDHSAGYKSGASPVQSSSDAESMETNTTTGIISKLPKKLSSAELYASALSVSVVGNGPSTAIVKQRMNARNPLLPPCTCKKECKEKVDYQTRKIIHKQFWARNYHERQQWVLESMTRYTPSRRKSFSRINRKESRMYYLPDNSGKQVEVCQNMFLRTLGFKHNTIINTIAKHTPLGQIHTTATDKLRRRKPHNKVNEETVRIIKSHLHSLHPSVTHYKREYAPKKRYLASDVSLKHMHSDCSASHPSKIITYEFYRTVVKEENISFIKQGQEECEQCQAFKVQHFVHKDSRHPESCGPCRIQQIHEEDAELARRLYSEHNKLASESAHHENTVYLSTTMQEPVLIPRMPSVNISFFVSRLVVFHQIFAPLGQMHKDMEHRVLACVWHEGITGRTAKDVTSAYEQAIHYFRDEHSLIIWCENCSAQSKNWTLFSSLVSIFNDSRRIVPQSLEIFYQERGHTFTSAESFQSDVEKSMRKRGNLYTFHDFIEAVERCGVNPKVIAMECTSFKEWTNGFSGAKASVHHPRLRDIKAIKVMNGDTHLYYKTEYSGKYIPFDFLKDSYKRETVDGPLSQSVQVNRGVSALKKDILVQNLCPLMTASKAEFWKDLVSSNVPDLNSTGTEVFTDM